jgi:hypothetical protein
MSDFVNDVINQVRKTDSNLFIQSTRISGGGKNREYTLRKRSKKWNTTRKGQRGGEKTKAEEEAGKRMQDITDTNALTEYLKNGGNDVPKFLTTSTENDTNNVFNTYLTNTYAKSPYVGKPIQQIDNEIESLTKNPNKTSDEIATLADLQKHKQFRTALGYQYGTVKKGWFGSDHVKKYPRAAIAQLKTAGIIDADQKQEMLGSLRRTSLSNKRGIVNPVEAEAETTTETEAETTDAPSDSGANPNVEVVTGGAKTAEEVANELFGKVSDKLSNMEDQILNKILDAVYYIIKHNPRSILESLAQILTSKGVTDGLNGASTKILICSCLYNNSTIFGNSLTETYMSDVYKGEKTSRPPKIGDNLNSLASPEFIDKFTNNLTNKLEMGVFHSKM